MVHEILEFFVVRPTNLGQIKSKVRLIYIHSGVGTWQKGGLKVIAKGTSKLPEKI